MLKAISCKIPAELKAKINKELDKIGKSKSDFLRELIYNYVDEHWSDDETLVNHTEAPVNQSSMNDKYQDIKKEVNGFLKGLK